MRALLAIVLLALCGWWSLPWLKTHLPPQWNPFIPLQVTDPPGWMTRYKLQRLSSDPAACLAVMRAASAQGRVSFREVPPLQGDCPIDQPLRISRFGEVTLSSSFLASCPMAVASTLYVTRSNAALQQAGITSPLRRIAHVGSYACRNIYHRQEGRRSEHATADAWDITGFQLADGRWLQVGKNWQQPPQAAAGLHALWRNGCASFGNALGPDYNAAHASHFHLGMRGAGFCR
ncbi:MULTISPECIES: extensin family protein [Pantoea]|uniref:Extensin family protein n=1 Tax=Pantoea dispersa TaxID=59814 RepID=A0ABY2ZW92_9GAMM|nr:extensin family protein [Pantoea dispersa]TQC71577.1 extensin family protein [Pantoea dispersa]